MKRDLHTETYEDILLFWLLSFSASASFKCWEVSKSTEEEGSQHIKYQRRWTRALVGEFIHGRWKMAASQTTSLVPTWSLCGLVKRFIPNCSILKVTAWFHIHNYSCMNVQFHYSLLTNHLLRTTIPAPFSMQWLISLLSPGSSFISNLKANISGLKHYPSSLYSVPFSVSTLHLSLAILSLSHPEIISQRNEGIIGAPLARSKWLLHLPLQLRDEWWPWR